MIKIDLGSGKWRSPGFITTDISPVFKPDIQCDLSKGIPCKDNSFEVIRAHHFLEHLSDTIFIMNEMWRICRNGAMVIIEVPHQSSPMAFADPTHKKIFNEESIKYFCVNGKHYWMHDLYGIKCRFLLENQEVVLDSNEHAIIRITLKAIKEQ